MGRDRETSRPDRVIRAAARSVTPAFTLNQVGKFALERAKAEERGALLDLITAQLMCALTMEAVLNHVGVKLFVEDAHEPELWAAVERRSPRDKLKAIAERARMPLNMGHQPFQDFGRMFKFRDDVAHGKPMTLRTDDIPPEAIDDEGWLS